MKHRIIAALALAIATGLLSSLGALAADAAPATITVPWGDWLASLLTASATIVVSLIGFVVHRFAPPAIAAFVTNDVIEKAVNYAIATTAGAAHGREAHIDVTNNLIAAAANWIIANEPKIADWADSNLRPLIVARLAAVGIVPADASLATLRLEQPAPEPAF